VRAGAAILAACVVCARPGWAQTAESPGAAPPPASASGETSFLVENVTRVEVWRYFDPPPNGGQHADYTFGGNRATLGVTYAGSRWSARGVLQYVRLENLPAGAIGPGLLGNGGAYFFQANGTFSYQFYLRSLSLSWRASRSGLWAEAGRLSRAADTERRSGDAAIDHVVTHELSGRLLGDAEWSFYQRAWDGVRGGIDRGGRALTITAAVPTQGTFEESANLPMDRVRVGAVEASAAPGTLVRRTRLDAFAVVYDDRRRINTRPDNSLRPAAAADIRVGAIGAAAVGAYPWTAGVTDASVWAAWQAGDWYGQSHRAAAATVGVGHRFVALPARPWVRAGVTWASGDADPADGRHGTFFPMLPAGDRVSRLNAYALMNVHDRWAAVETRLHPALDVGAAVRHVGLASAFDRWYQGTGATNRVGNYFGYQGRNTGGATTIGTVVEGSAAWRARRWWTLRAYAARVAGGDAVARLFDGRRLVTAWLESTVRF